MSLPLSTDIRESEISGYVDGEKSNLDEKLVEVGRSTVWHFIGIAAHPPMPEIDHDSTRYSYYLEKNGKRIELYFLNKHNTTNVCNVNNQWFSFEFNPGYEYFNVIQFNFEKQHKNHKIRTTLPDAISEMYIDRKATSLVWREVNLNYHEYDLKSGSVKRRFFVPSQSELGEMLKINVPTSNYDEMEFLEAVDFGNNGEKENNAKTIAKTNSLDVLKNASRSKDFLIRWAVVVNPNSTKQIIEELKNDDSYYVASAARKRLALNKI